MSSGSRTGSAGCRVSSTAGALWRASGPTSARIASPSNFYLDPFPVRFLPPFPVPFPIAAFLARGGFGFGGWERRLKDPGLGRELDLVERFGRASRFPLLDSLRPLFLSSRANLRTVLARAAPPMRPPPPTLHACQPAKRLWPCAWRTQDDFCVDLRLAKGGHGSVFYGWRMISQRET